MTLDERRVYVERLDAERKRVAERNLKALRAERAFNEMPRDWACEALARIEALEGEKR